MKQKKNKIPENFLKECQEVVKSFNEKQEGFIVKIEKFNEEFNKFIKYIEPVYREFFNLMFYTGLRPGEAIELKTSD